MKCPNRNTYRRGRDIFWNNSITVLLFCDVDNLWVTIELILFFSTFQAWEKYFTSYNGKASMS